MIKYPSIEQFRNVIRTVKTQHDYVGRDEGDSPIYKHTSDYPKLTFKGTVKLHGTNAGIVKYKDRIEFQSRERVLSLEQDNAGFMLRMLGKNLDFLFSHILFEESIAVFGEWCGGSIQKGVALSKLPKMFVIFGFLVDGEWIDFVRHDNSQGIYHIEQFPTCTVEIDFNAPEHIQNDLIEKTIAVEEKCPVGAYFGVEGIGEGIVFTCVHDATLKFKSKGEKHSASKVKVLNSVDVEEVESIRDFVEYAVTENRLNQGLQSLKEQGMEIHQKNTGEFIRWVVNDIIKEESDTIVKNQINMKKASGQLASKCKAFFFNSL